MVDLALVRLNILNVVSCVYFSSRFDSFQSIILFMYYNRNALNTCAYNTVYVGQDALTNTNKKTNEYIYTMITVIAIYMKIETN